MKKDISKEIAGMKEMLEISIQQKSAVDSDAKKNIAVLQTNHTEVIASLVRIENEIGELNVKVSKTNGNVQGLQLWKASSGGWIKGFGVSVACIIALIGVIYFSLSNSESKTQNLIEKHIQETK